MRTLVFDQAKHCGWALFEENELIEYGVEKFGDDKTTYENILLPAFQFVGKALTETRAENAVIESIQYQSNMSTYRKLAMLQGVFVYAFLEQDIPYQIIESSKWKSLCGIKGRKRQEQKENAILFVKNKFNIDVTSDEADAICMGWSVVNNLEG